MKTYITPTIESSSFVGAMLMYTPSDSLGDKMKEGMGKPKEDDPVF